MSANKGTLVVIKIGDNDSPENFTTMGGMRVSLLKVNQQLLETTNVESGSWRKLSSAGIRAASIGGRGLFTDSASESLLRSYALSGSVRNYQFHFGNGDMLAGAFIITEYERTGEIDSEESYSVRLESAGTLTYTAS